MPVNDELSDKELALYLRRGTIHDFQVQAADRLEQQAAEIAALRAAETTMADPAADDVRAECSRTLRIIAADLRMAGDVQQVELTEDGVTPQFLTLADDLWLIALRLDPDGTWADQRDPDRVAGSVTPTGDDDE